MIIKTFKKWFFTIILTNRTEQNVKMCLKIQDGSHLNRPTCLASQSLYKGVAFCKQHVYPLQMLVEGCHWTHRYFKQFSRIKETDTMSICIFRPYYLDTLKMAAIENKGKMKTRLNHLTIIGFTSNWWLLVWYWGWLSPWNQNYRKR